MKLHQPPATEVLNAVLFLHPTQRAVLDFAALSIVACESDIRGRRPSGTGYILVFVCVRESTFRFYSRCTDVEPHISWCGEPPVRHIEGNTPLRP